MSYPRGRALNLKKRFAVEGADTIYLTATGQPATAQPADDKYIASRSNCRNVTILYNNPSSVRLAQF